VASMHFCRLNMVLTSCLYLRCRSLSLLKYVCVVFLSASICSRRLRCFSACVNDILLTSITYIKYDTKNRSTGVKFGVENVASYLSKGSKPQRSRTYAHGGPSISQRKQHISHVAYNIFFNPAIHERARNYKMLTLKKAIKNLNSANVNNNT